MLLHVRTHFCFLQLSLPCFEKEEDYAYYLSGSATVFGMSGIFRFLRSVAVRSATAVTALRYLCRWETDIGEHLFLHTFCEGIR